MPDLQGDLFHSGPLKYHIDLVYKAHKPFTSEVGDSLGVRYCSISDYEKLSQDSGLIYSIRNAKYLYRAGLASITSLVQIPFVTKKCQVCYLISHGIKKIENLSQLSFKFKIPDAFALKFTDPLKCRFRI